MKGLARAFLLDFQAVAYVHSRELASAKAKAGQKSCRYCQSCLKICRRMDIGMLLRVDVFKFGELNVEM